jgi:hypothetical protein
VGEDASGMSSSWESAANVGYWTDEAEESSRLGSRLVYPPALILSLLLNIYSVSPGPTRRGDRDDWLVTFDQLIYESTKYLELPYQRKFQVRYSVSKPEPN